jgi:hypothetical protein
MHHLHGRLPQSEDPALLGPQCCHHGRGSGPFVPSIFFVLAGNIFSFLDGLTVPCVIINLTDELRFFDTMEIAPPP